MRIAKFRSCSSIRRESLRLSRQSSSLGDLTGMLEREASWNGLFEEIAFGVCSYLTTVEKYGI